MENNTQDNDNKKKIRDSKSKKKLKNPQFVGGLVGGVVSSALLVGVGFAVFQPTTTTNSNGDTVLTTGSQGTTTVSNVSYNVTSDTTEAIAKVKDAVVSVFNIQEQTTTQQGGISGMFGNQESQDSDSSTESTEDVSSEGSGVIYKKDGDKAYIVTNNHVVDGASSLEVMLSDGTKVTAKLVGTDSYSDLAVLEIDSDKVTTVAEFGDSDSLTLGEPAIAIGSPLGSDYANSVTEGIISGTDRNITSTESGSTTSINAIQTDAAINPGNSGGPLINTAGQVIGINSVKIAESSSSVSVEGMGFAIPSNDVVSIINQLESKGSVSRPMLGVTMADLSYVSSAQRKSILNLPDTVTEGVLVNSVQTASPAEEAGLEKYDVITAIDGEAVTSSTDLMSKLYEHQVGDSIKLTYYRGSDEKTVTVKLSLDKSSLDTSSTTSSSSESSDNYTQR